MSHFRSSLADRSDTKQSVEDAANEILRNDRRERSASTAVIDLLCKRDAVRRDRRRRALVERNLILLELFVSPASTRSAEELLMEKQGQAQAAAALLRVLKKFANDKAVKSVMVTVVLGDISFFKTRELAEACQLREDVVRAAKERLKYFARTQRNLLDAAA